MATAIPAAFSTGSLQNPAFASCSASSSSSGASTSTSSAPVAPSYDKRVHGIARGGAVARTRVGAARCMAPDEEKMTRRSPLDFPVEWDRPRPGRRPDIFPQFSPMKTPLPTPLPADPPEEDEDDDEKKEDEEENPENEPEKPDVSFLL